MANSDIRVYVQWSKPTVFAGEEIECCITFKNIASPPGGSTVALRDQDARLCVPPLNDRSRKTSQLTPKVPPAVRNHRPALSLDQSSSFRREADSWSQPQTKTTSQDPRPHRRSVSIISLSQSDSIVEESQSQDGTTITSGRSDRGHARAASLQILPQRDSIQRDSPVSAPLTNRSATTPSPRFPPPRPHAGHSRTQSRLSVRNITAPLSSTPENASKSHQALERTFKFPAGAVDDVTQSTSTKLDYQESAGLKSPRVSNRHSVASSTELITPVTKVLTPLKYGDTPRSSGEFYATSNNSTETLASEYLSQQRPRLVSQTSHIRRTSNLNPASAQRPSETLMMGYAQASGSFIIDGSLMSQAIFEEVKKKGVIGGSGGGVVGVESKKRDSGMFRGFGWSSLGESFSGFLNGGELSSIKEMRGAVSSKSIPLLSTPQSILFVDLKLGPGESRSWQYTFRLPRGLPPSHRGKAMKISYQLVIGVQRQGGIREQLVRSVETPFRVLGSVNSHGELLGHDLMSPYILLQDEAKIEVVTANAEKKSAKLQVEMKVNKPQSSLDDFLEYVDELLDKPRQNSSLGLLSPTATRASRRQSSIQESGTAKHAIDMAILKSNLATEQQQSANRFEIARNGMKVAVVMLARPAYRLGEVVTVVVEFTDAQIPCYAIHASLETSEKIDPSIALRSDASIHRVTRKIYASHSETTLFARRVVFTPTIPLQATPNFVTSNISLEWTILIEFVTPRLSGSALSEELPSTSLLEEISRDDRGVILAAAERLDCESFEVAVPIRVYGALGSMEKGLMSDGLVI